MGERKVKWGVLYNKGSFWVGLHYSQFNRRLCINVVPCVTIWITLRGGYTPVSGAF
jgi:hypothetical protein